MNARHLPRSTPFDPADDPPGSIDPLGTVAGAEQLADVLLPGVTARMWRARLLTFSAVAALVAKRAADGREERLLDARLAFERLFVSAVARQEGDGGAWAEATRRLPGIGRARQALHSGDQPLAPTNFLVGQAVNGPFGVILRLARDIGVVDEATELGRGGIDLLTAWSSEQNLSGLLDDSIQSDGARWVRSLTQKVSNHVDDTRNWPAAGWGEWASLADRLRLDNLGRRERKIIRRLLAHDPLGVRGRVLDRLESQAVFDVYQTAHRDHSRGGVERAVLVDGLCTTSSADEVDRTIALTVKLIDAYESVAGRLESAFRSLLWGLTRRHGHATRADVLGEPAVGKLLVKVRSALASAVGRLRTALQAFETDALAGQRGSVDLDRTCRLIEDATSASAGVEECATVLLDRHQRVQKEKGKGVWVEEDKRWTLLPGFGDTSDEPPEFPEYIHPLRVTNAYSLLGDLDHRFKVRASRDEAEDQ